MLKNSGATAGAYGPTANATPAFNGTFSVPQITVDAKGRVTSAVARTVKIPANPVMTKATASAAGKAGLVPAPATGAQGKCLRGDGTWGNPQYADSAGNANGLGAKDFVDAHVAGTPLWLLGLHSDGKLRPFAKGDLAVNSADTYPNTQIINNTSGWVLPAGGTWGYISMYAGDGLRCTSGRAAGGTRILNANTLFYFGFALRIA